MSSSAPRGAFAPLARLRIIAVVAPLLFTGCATLTKGTSQTVTVNTDPTGASCRMTRDGQTVAVINPTPGSIPVDKSHKDIAVVCEKAGFRASAGTMASSFQSMTFGNILFGGLIGVAIDAGSGAMHEYPTFVTLTLIPESFKSDGERDAFFVMKAMFETEYAEALALIKQRCGNATNCDEQLQKAEASRVSKLAEIEAKRVQSKIGS